MTEAPAADSRVLRGGCHCGRVGIEFVSSVDPSALEPRTCDCSYCRKHGASYVSDPRGSLRIETREPGAIGLYRQGSRNARFLACRHCGVLVAAMFDDVAGTFGAVNSRCLDGAVAFGPERTVSPRTLAPEERRRRWIRLWTPRVTVGPASGG